MFESSKLLVLGKAVCAIAIGGFLVSVLLDQARIRISARSPATGKGEYGGDLDVLRSCWTPPEAPGESNHYFDLWSPNSLPILARVNGLTNNHALFVDSHGRAEPSSAGKGYCFYPRESLLTRGQETPYFSVGDLADVLGPGDSAEIHNIVLAGCNEAGRFRSEEVRRYFVNATNITYMAPGELAFKPMFYQAIVLPSSEIKPLYGKVKKAPGGAIECAFVETPRWGAKRLGVYRADLYLPGAPTPYRTIRKAGRELLDPGFVPASSLRADASPAGNPP